MTIVALAVIAGIGFFVLSQKGKDMAGRKDMGRSNAKSADNDSTLYKQYAALKGEDYDRTFIAGMIEHHRGAVDMAKLAMANARHRELKALAKDIIAAQTKEINEMKSWQTSFGQPAEIAERFKTEFNVAASCCFNNQCHFVPASFPEGKVGDIMSLKTGQRFFPGGILGGNL